MESELEEVICGICPEGLVTSVGRLVWVLSPESLEASSKENERHSERSSDRPHGNYPHT